MAFLQGLLSTIQNLVRFRVTTPMVEHLAAAPVVPAGEAVNLQGDASGNLNVNIAAAAAGPLEVEGADADGGAVAHKPVLVGGVDKAGLVQQLLVDGAGQVYTVGGGSVGGGNNIWSNPQDFTATPNVGAKTITFAAFTSTVLSSVIATLNFSSAIIKRVNTGTGVVDILPTSSVAYAAGVLTLDDMDAVFALNDQVQVFLPGPDKGYDQAADHARVGGTAADDAAAAGNPVQAGGVYLSDWLLNPLDAGDAGHLLLDEIRALVTRSRAYDPTTDADKTVPAWSALDQWEPQPIVQSVDNVNATYSYPLEMDAFHGWSAVMDFVSTASVAGIATVTVHASNDEGLTALTADYMPVTALLFGVASIVIPAATADTNLVLDPGLYNPGYGKFKYVRIDITTSGLAGAGQVISWAGYARKSS